MDLLTIDGGVVGVFCLGLELFVSASQERALRASTKAKRGRQDSLCVDLSVILSGF